MKRFSCQLFQLAVVLLGIRPLSAQVQGQWVNTGALQTARESSAQVLIVGGKVLSIGGIDSNGNLIASAEVYSAGPGTWKLTGSMADAREDFPAVALKSGKVLVSGGLGPSNTVLAAAELYDPATGAWSSAGSLSVARFSHTATLLQSGKVLVAGGCTSSVSCTDTNVSEVYDPTTNSWSTTGSLNIARYSHTAVLLKNGKVLAIAGSASTSCELYDPTTGTWSNTASTNVARINNGTTLLADGKVLVTGGVQGGRFPISSAEIYDPSANAWTLTGSMKTGRYAHTATLLTDGTVLVAGGVGQAISCGKDCVGYIPTAKAEIYNEAAGKFTATANLNRARAYHSTTRLGNGRALADGGSGTTSTCCVVLNAAEIYTPLTTTLSSSSLNYGVLEIGSTSAPQTVTVTNVSSHSVTFASISSNSGDFPESNTCPSTLNAGLNCTITVAFKPTAAGTRTGTVTLKDNDPGSPTQTIALTGVGAANAMTLIPSSLTFPAQIPGTTTSQSITLYNDGTAAVSITNIGISPAGSTFTQTNNCQSTLNPNTNCVIQVSFTPPESGNFTATLSVIDSDTSSPQTASLSGTGSD